MYRYKIVNGDPAWCNWCDSLHKYRVGVCMPFEAYEAHTQQERDRWQMRKVMSLPQARSQPYMSPKYAELPSMGGEAYLEFPSEEVFLAWHMSWS